MLLLTLTNEQISCYLDLKAEFLKTCPRHLWLQEVVKTRLTESRVEMKTLAWTDPFTTQPKGNAALFIRKKKKFPYI